MLAGLGAQCLDCVFSLSEGLLSTLQHRFLLKTYSNAFHLTGTYDCNQRLWAGECYGTSLRAGGWCNQTCGVCSGRTPCIERVPTGECHAAGSQAQIAGSAQGHEQA